MMLLIRNATGVATFLYAPEVLRSLGVLVQPEPVEKPTPSNEKVHRVGIIMRVVIAFIIFTIIGTIFIGVACSGETLQQGIRYKIIRPMYLMAVYDSLNNRQLSRETARAYLHSEQYANKSYVAFQCEVPAGTVMTIIRPLPKVWHLPFFANRYLIKLDPDLSRELDVVLELNRGLEGNLDGLNSEFFSRQ